jgi:type VI secretion system protein ImpG
MNPDLIKYYSQELQHLREMGGEFAREFPKIAGRLGLESLECADPYVERLLEGFSFLAARVQLKIDAEFPRFTQHLAELVYPHYLAPTPSMAIVQIQPDLSSSSLADGVQIPRGSALRSVLDRNGSTRCEYRSAHELTLWPLEIAEAKFFTHAGSLGGADATLPAGIKAGLRLRLRATGGLKINQLKLDRLVLYLRGTDGLPTRIHERLLGSVSGVVVMPVKRPAAWHRELPATSVRPVGFAEDEALLPLSRQSFQGYRLLQEYFAFSQRFMFVAIEGLQPAFRCCADTEIEVVVLLKRADPHLEQSLGAANFALHCTPAVNLFSRRTDRIALSDEQFEYHVIADRTRPMDFEIYQIETVTGYSAGAGGEQPFEPFYHARDLGAAYRAGAYYQVRREKRLPSSRQSERGPRTSYLGSEMFIALVDAANAPYRADLRQLGLQVLCTNRDHAGRRGTRRFHARCRSARAKRALRERAEPPVAVVCARSGRVAAVEPPVAELCVAARQRHERGRTRDARSARPLLSGRRCGEPAPDRRRALDRLALGDAAFAVRRTDRVRPRPRSDADARRRGVRRRRRVPARRRARLLFRTIRIDQFVHRDRREDALAR